MGDRDAGTDRGAAGLFGKLPARGDFVRRNLPASFAVAWDSWLADVLADSRARLGRGWLPAFLEAPVWCFALAPGVCGPAAACGVWLPSVDRAGLYFPLALVGMVPLAPPVWFAACEAAGRAALADATPEEVLHRLPPPPADPAGGPAAGSLWWTAGSRRVRGGRRTLPGLPDGAAFAAMLDEAAAAATAATA